MNIHLKNKQLNMYPIAFKKAAKPLLRCMLIPSHKGTKTDSKASMPYGVAASANAAIAKAVIILTFYYSSLKPCSIISIIFFK